MDGVSRSAVEAALRKARSFPVSRLAGDVKRGRIIMRKDVIVLGAGIVGVSVAVHLQQRGRSVLLVDRRGPGEETSYGNAGLIQREGVYPYGFPHDFGALLRYATNRTIDAHYHLAALPKLAPFLFRYWMHSRPEEHRAIARLYAPLIEHSVVEHAALAEAAGADRSDPPDRLDEGLPQPEGDGRAASATSKRRSAISGSISKPSTGRALSPANPICEATSRAASIGPTRRRSTIRYELTMAYVRLFEKLGGELAEGDARSLEEKPDGWSVTTRAGAVEARDVVVALGPWADLVTQAPRLPPAARGQARLPHALQAGRQCGAQPPDARFRARLFPGADGEGHPPHDGRRIRRPRRAEDAGAARSAPSRSPRRSSRSASGSIPSPGWACAPARPT